MFLFRKIVKASSIRLQSSLLNPDRKISTREKNDQTYLDFEEFDEAKKLDVEITDKLNKAAKRETARRTIFAQHSIKAEEIECDLREMDEALGDPSAVRDFVVSALNVLVGSRISESKEGYELETINLSHSLGMFARKLSATILVSFDSPTPTVTCTWAQSSPRRGIMPYRPCS